MSKLKKISKGIHLRWYHFLVFWLPGGMFILTALIAIQFKLHKSA